MKIFVFAYNRFADMTTSLALSAEGLRHVVLCHSGEDALRFVDGGTARIADLIATGNPKGLAYQRNSALELLEDGEWCLMLCDDWLHTTEVEQYDTATSPLPIDTTNTTEWNRRFRRTKITWRQLLKRAEETVAEAERRKMCLAGFVGFNNSLFRKNKWKRNTLVDGRALLIKKTALRFDTQAQMIDDVSFTAANIEAFGGTLINQWVLPEFSRYTRGAFGSKTERTEQRRKECAYLEAQYPDLVRVAEKPGWPTGTHIRLRHLKGDALLKWRIAIKHFREQRGAA